MRGASLRAAIVYWLATLGMAAWLDFGGMESWVGKELGLAHLGSARRRLRLAA